jgi:hypothetical protein
MYGHYGTVRGYHNYTNNTKLDDNLQHEILAIVQPLAHHRNGKPMGDEASIDGADIFGPQMKIEDVALHDAIYNYRAAIIELGKCMIRLIAAELGCATTTTTTTFDFEWLNDLFSPMRINYYPTCESVNDPFDVGMKEHSDLG